MVNAEKWGAKIKNWRRCQLAIDYILCVASLVFSTSSVFKAVDHEHPCIFFFCYVSHAVVFGTYPSVAPS